MTDTGSPELMHRGVARELGIEIVDGAWGVGAARTLEDLQSRFGISRTVAREASRQLEAMGLVVARRRLGLVAQPMSQWNVLDPTLIEWRLRSTQREDQIYTLTQLRLAVEPAAAEGAARFASIQTRAALLATAAELRRTGEAGDLRAFLSHDIEFHRTLLSSCNNELFAQLAGLVAIVLQGRTELGLMPAHPKPEALAGHEEVARAIFDGDSDAAREAMQRVLDEVRQVFGAAQQARVEASRAQ